MKSGFSSFCMQALHMYEFRKSDYHWNKPPVRWKKKQIPQMFSMLVCKTDIQDISTLSGSNYSF